MTPGRRRDSNTTAEMNSNDCVLPPTYLVTKPGEGRRFALLIVAEPQLVYETTTRTSLMTSEPELS